MGKKLTFYALFYFTSLVLMRLCGIFAKILMARSITPYEYGLITLIVLAIPGTMQLITNFCFFDILGHATEGRKYFGFTLIYGTISTTIIAIIIFLFPTQIFTFLNIPEGVWSLASIVIIAVVFAVTIGGDIIGILRGKRNHTLAASYSAAPSILRLFFIIFAVYIFGITDFNLMLIIFALPAIIVVIPVILIKRKTIIKSFQSFSLPTKEIMAFGFTFFILNAWLSLSQNINSVIISHDLGVTWQGYFDVSLSIVAIITFFSTAIYIIAAPETTHDNRSEIMHEKGGFGDIGRLLFSMCLLCVVIIYFYGSQLTTLLFTENYSIAGDYLTILALGYSVLFIQQFCAFLNVSHKGKKGISRLSLVTVVSIVIFPFFTHLMILYFKFVGVYLAMTIYIVCYTLITIVLIEDRTPLILLIKKFDRLALSVLGTFLIIYLLDFPLIPGIFTTLVLFTLFVFLLGYVDKDIIWDIIRLKSKKI
jgi:O-antigen/teichoic acid export membrane protein